MERVRDQRNEAISQSSKGARLHELLDLLEERLSENPLGADLKDFQKSIAAFSDRLGRLKKMAEERSGRGH